MKTPEEFKNDVYAKSKVYANKKKKTKRIVTSCLAVVLCFGVVFAAAKLLPIKNNAENHVNSGGEETVKEKNVSAAEFDAPTDVSQTLSDQPDSPGGEKTVQSEEVSAAEFNDPTAEGKRENGYFTIDKSSSAVDLGKLVSSAEEIKSAGGINETFKSSFFDFSSEMLRYSYESGKNTLVSPTSAVFALAMTANGANESVQSDMLHVIADGLTMDELNAYLYTYARSLMSGDGYTLGIADSVWFRSDGTLKVNEKFLEKVSKYYDADIFGVPYDETTVKDINGWVSRKTDGMIKKIYDSPDDFANTVLTLINAVVFEAEWRNCETSYKDVEKSFFNSKGEEEKTEFFSFVESLGYIDTDDTVGFIKNYKGKYAFAAFLPDEDVSIDDYVASLDGKKLASLLSSAEYEDVKIEMPEFTCDVDFEMNDMLQKLGMASAYAGGFENMAISEYGPIAIGNVFQKTHIEMMPTGTKAAAVTVVVMPGACIDISDIVTIALNRPFVYAIIDTENGLPLFVGAVNTIK